VPQVTGCFVVPLIESTDQDLAVLPRQEWCNFLFLTP